MSEHRTDFLVVYVTVPPNQARELARSLVQKRLCACVQILPNAQSIYHWGGKIEEETEALLMIKTRQQHFEQLRLHVAAKHPYDVPEIIAVPINKAHPPYAAWLAEEMPLRESVR